MKKINPTDFRKGIFPIWRGFRHNWQYNHRTNRLGSFIDKDDQSFYTYHSGASGTGIDTLFFQDHYTLIKSDNAEYCIEKITFKHLKAKEGETVYFEENIKVSKPISENNKQFGVLLNGFDLICNTKADKLHQLGFEILPIQAEDDYTIYTLKGHINLDCKSPECDQKNEFNYTLDIYLLFLKSTDFVYEKSSGSFLNNYQWKIQNHHEINVFSTGQKEAILFLENNLTDYPIYAIGYRKIAIAITNETNQSEKIDKTVHLLDLNINVKNFRPLSTNQILINQEIFFNNWRKHMKKINFHSSFAFRQKGSFKGEVKLAVFRFKEAEISTSGYNEGKIEWKANNANPDADSIKKVKIIAIDAENLLA